MYKRGSVDPRYETINIYAFKILMSEVETTAEFRLRFVNELTTYANTYATDSSLYPVLHEILNHAFFINDYKQGKLHPEVVSNFIDATLSQNESLIYVKNNKITTYSELSTTYELFKMELDKLSITNELYEMKQFIDDIEHKDDKSINEIIKKYDTVVTNLYLKRKEKNINVLSNNDSISIGDSNKSIDNMFSNFGKQLEESSIIPSGIPYLDSYILPGGFEPKRLYIFGATPGLGKSLLLMNMFKNAAYNTHTPNVKVLVDKKATLDTEKNTYTTIKDSIFAYITLENFKEETMLRLLSNIMYMDKSHIENIIYISKVYIPMILKNENVDNTEYLKYFKKNKLDNLSTTIKSTLNHKIVKKIIKTYKYLLKSKKISQSEIVRNNNMISKFETDQSFVYYEQESVNYLYKLQNEDLEFIRKAFIHFLEMYDKMLDILHLNGYKNIIDIKYFPPYTTSISSIMHYLDSLLETHKDKKIGAIYIDYLDLLAGDTSSDLYRLELGNITASLKKIATEYNCPLITLTQVNGTGYKNTGENPGLASVTESKKKVEHTDFYASLTPNAKFDTSLYDTLEDGQVTFRKSIRNLNIYVNKNRNGALGNGNLIVYYPHMKLYSINSSDLKDINLIPVLTEYAVNDPDNFNILELD